MNAKAREDDFDRGVLHFRNRRYRAALKCFERAIRKGGGQSLPYYLKGLALEKLGQLKRGAKYRGWGEGAAVLEHERSLMPEDSVADLRKEVQALLGRAGRPKA
ncbi:MAG: hypothetical protein HY077_14830 [Elusimicrobia bacterium]|nr:hypothetical protein [Elusimicrobiota bacterium]